MANEIELKLEVSPAAAKHFIGAPWLKKLTTAPATTERLVSVYYDTNDLALRDKRAALRIRKIGGKHIQTVKLDGRGGHSAFGRLEWEQEVAGSRPDLRKAKTKELAGLKLKKFDGTLKPIFETAVTRTAIPVHYQGSNLEVAVDLGQVRTGRKRLPIHEIEIELKDGAPAAVAQLGAEIAEHVCAIYGVSSKGERGYALREDKLKKAVGAFSIVLDNAMQASEAFAIIGLSCLHHFAGNQSAVAAGDPEGVHQMRIGLRRLRAAMSLFKEMLRHPETETVKNELKWLTGELGHARDMDVLLDNALRPLENDAAASDAVKALKSELTGRRKVALERAKAAVRSERYRKLVLNTAFFLTCGKWATSEDPLIEARRRQKVVKFGAQELERRHQKILGKLESLKKLGDHQRHKLRIAIKKLRYATEFFETLFAGRAKREALTKVLKKLQSSLGELNDMRMHADMAHRFSDPDSTLELKAPKALAMGLITGAERTKSSKLLSDAARAGKRLASIKPFWRS